jgi:hypothetical protein
VVVSLEPLLALVYKTQRFPVLGLGLGVWGRPSYERTLSCLLRDLLSNGQSKTIPHQRNHLNPSLGMSNFFQ